MITAFIASGILTVLIAYIRALQVGAFDDWRKYKLSTKIGAHCFFTGACFLIGGILCVLFTYIIRGVMGV